MSSLSKSSIRRSPVRSSPTPTSIASAADAEPLPTLEVAAAQLEANLSPEQRWRFQARKEWARRALPNLMTPDEFRTIATPEQLRAVVKVFGTVDEFHATATELLERETVFPWPDEIHIHPDGSIKLFW
jgi:hypothetical protein